MRDQSNPRPIRDVTDPLNRNRGPCAAKLKDSKMEVLSQPMKSADPPECREELVVRLDVMRRNESFCDVKVVVKDKEGRTGGVCRTVHEQKKQRITDHGICQVPCVL